IGYTTSIDRPDDSALTNIQIEGADADPYSSYTTEATVDVSAFAWVKSGTTISEDVLQGVVESEITLDASVSYKLNSSFLVKDGGKLIIPAGTKITAAAGGTSVYIAVLKGGQIDIQGTPDNPVVMASETAQPGDW